MADKKISALTGATTPLAGTEVLPIVQSNATVKVAVSDLTTGRAISATQLTLTTGNLIVSDGKGIDFSATPNTGTSELLNDYEEGTFTPAQGPEVTVVGAYSSTGTYTKIGRQVTVKIKLAGSVSIACTPFGRLLTDLPFSSAAGDSAGTMWVEGVTEARIALISGSGTTMYATAAFGAPATQVIITATYFV
jgi:hypothetical protein